MLRTINQLISLLAPICMYKIGSLRQVKLMTAFVLGSRFVLFCCNIPVYCMSMVCSDVFQASQVQIKVVVEADSRRRLFDVSSKH